MFGKPKKTTSSQKLSPLPGSMDSPRSLPKREKSGFLHRSISSQKISPSTQKYERQLSEAKLDPKTKTTLEAQAHRQISELYKQAAQHEPLAQLYIAIDQEQYAHDNSNFEKFRSFFYDLGAMEDEGAFNNAFMWCLWQCDSALSADLQDPIYKEKKANAAFSKANEINQNYPVAAQALYAWADSLGHPNAKEHFKPETLSVQNRFNATEKEYNKITQHIQNIVDQGDTHERNQEFLTQANKYYLTVPVLARRLYQEAAECGSVEGKIEFAKMLLKGIGGTANIHRALKELESITANPKDTTQAALNEACRILGTCYGMGVQHPVSKEYIVHAQPEKAHFCRKMISYK